MKISPVNIVRNVGLFYDSDDIKSLGVNFDSIVEDLKQLDETSYADKINLYRTNANII